MRKNRQFGLGLETLERREVFAGMPGIEGFDIYDAPVQYRDAADVQRGLEDNERQTPDYRYEVREHSGEHANRFLHDGTPCRAVSATAVDQIYFDGSDVGLTSMEEGESCGI